MFLLPLLLLSCLGSFTLATLSTSPTPTPTSSTPKCNPDNCLRAITGTRTCSTQLSTALADCSSALIITDFPVSTVTLYSTLVDSTSTVLLNPTPPAVANANEIEKREEMGKRQIKFQTLPSYAKPCTDFYAYSSACKCLGVTASVVTGSAYSTTTVYWWTFVTTTTTVTVPSSIASSSSAIKASTSTSSSSSTSPPSPTCTANILTDPLNCGSCGTVCSSGKCEKGICTTSCIPKTCGAITTCNASSSCYCFTPSPPPNSLSSPPNSPFPPILSPAAGGGICAPNAVCSDLTACDTDTDCDTGFVCAVETCCSEDGDVFPGVCLRGGREGPGGGVCGNPEADAGGLFRRGVGLGEGRRALMERAGRRGMVGKRGRTAAY
ncbi:hypothetical protein VTL71DRAFT_14757 [Oculimacula yallundae]|uniref:Antifreeze protein n=1 Tax=Oculimacula yallundae TaxID=86028 RepID=A0ABR4CK21_9HELO